VLQPFQSREGFVFTVAAVCWSSIDTVTCRAAGMSLVCVLMSLVEFWWDVSNQCNGLAAPLEIISYHKYRKIVMF